MEYQDKYLLKLTDGRVEPIHDLEDALRIVIVDEDTVGAKDITFAYCKFAPHTSFHKKHVHAHSEEIMYILSGRGICGVGKEEFEVSKADTLWVPKGEVHWAYNPFDEPFEMLFIYTKPSLQKAGYKVVEKDDQ